MEDIDRFRMFWCVCIPVRFEIGIIALYISYRVPELLPFVGAPATAAVVLGFAAAVVETLLGYKTHGGLGGVVWWSRVRFVHMALYAACSVSAFFQKEWAGAFLDGALTWQWLLTWYWAAGVADVAVGG